MEPFFFNEDCGSLFGVYHAPSGRVPGRTGVVLCYPAGSEYENAHRTCVHLAEALASAGLHALRFDYSGCGDSEGDFEKATVDGWLRDISTAVEQLRTGTGVERVVLVGIRLGASLALLSAGRIPSVSELVLYDPVADGAAYLEELGQRHRDRLLENSQAADTSAADSGSLELLGYCYSASLRQAISAIDLTAPSSLPLRHVLVVESTDRTGLDDFTRTLERTGAKVDQRCIEALQTWSQPGETPVPLEIIETIVNWLREDHR